MINLARRMVTRPYCFSSSRYNINYYEVLELESGATAAAIKKAYSQLTENIKPELDAERFKALNEAFVILSDLKTRDAYDSLLSVRKQFYLNDEKAAPPATKSYLATRKQRSEQSLRKMINIDQFGRYRGGLPRKGTNLRGNSLGETGTLYRQEQIEEQHNPHPEYNVITQEKAESFKNFHLNEHKARTMTWPWFTCEVNYDYFTFPTFRKKYWPIFQLFVLLFYILPTLYYSIEKIEKQQGTKEFKAKAEQRRAAKERKEREAQEQAENSEATAQA